MKSNKVTQLIREELKKAIKEQSRQRYVATIEFFVWGDTENIAQQEVQQIINMIDEKYDNSPQLTDLTPQSFGSIAGKPIKTRQEQKMTEATAITKQPRYKDIFRMIGEYMFSINVNMKPKQLHDLTLEIIDFLDWNRTPEATISDIIGQYLFSVNIKLKSRQIKDLSDEIKEYILTNKSAFNT